MNLPFMIHLCAVQAYAMVERIGYPESILNDTELDRMYKEVNSVSGSLHSFTDHFNRPSAAIWRVCVCVCVCPDNNF